jgi:Domain of unknown function (DUF5069)
MKTQTSFIDLTKRPPRSFRVRLGNYVILARMLDKGRATLAAKNAEYNYNSGTDQHLVRFLGFDPNALLRSWPPAKATAKSLNGSSPIPKRRAHRGKSKPGPLSWKDAGRTATRKLLRSLPNMSENSARHARTSRHGLKPSNWTTTSALEEKCKSRIHTNNEEQKIEKQKRKNV